MIAKMSSTKRFQIFGFTEVMSKARCSKCSMNRFATGDEAVAFFLFFPNDGMGIRSKTLRLLKSKNDS